MTRRRRIAGLAALTALALSACASGDAKVSEVRDAVREAGATGEQADCAEEQFDREFSQDQLNDIGGAEQLDDLDQGLADQVRAILDECVGGGSSSTTEEGGEPSDSTTTTESGDTTSTTAAG